jgi:hypothetical protein
VFALVGLARGPALRFVVALAATAGVLVATAGVLVPMAGVLSAMGREAVKVFASGVACTVWRGTVVAAAAVATTAGRAAGIPPLLRAGGNGENPSSSSVGSGGGCSRSGESRLFCEVSGGGRRPNSSSSCRMLQPRLRSVSGVLSVSSWRIDQPRAP